MKNKIYTLILLLALSIQSCSFLDVVPDDTATLDDAFKNESTARGFIYGCYGYIPDYSNFRTNFSWLMSNEIVCTKHWGLQWFSFLKVQQLNYSSSDPVLDIWQQCYAGIKQCHIFLQNIDKVVPLTMSESEYATQKTIWIGEAKFLLAYFHSILLQNYGPIALVDTDIDLSSAGEDYFRPRKPYDECVETIARLFDEAMVDLPDNVVNNDLGRATKSIAQSLKARMYLFSASPLYNGNSEFYSSFIAKDGSHLISQTFDKEKWKIVMDETLKAIKMVESQGVKLYEYKSNDGEILNDFDQAVANQRYTMVDPWNQELIWGHSGTKEASGGGYSYQTHVMPQGLCPRGSVPYGAMGPTLRTVEFFYSKNGVPCEEDPQYDWDKRMEIMDGDSTIYLHRDREPRFYAFIGHDRGPYEVNGGSVTLKLRMKEQNGVYQDDLNANHLYSGYALKKGVHPDNTASSTGSFIITPYPYPIIRLAELYLNYVEACVEYTGSLDGNATNYFNAIRAKAGLPTLAESFASPTGESLMKIVKRERMLEFMFEGHWLYDLKRWKEAEEFFAPDANGMRGLTSAGKTAEEFYKARVLPERLFLFQSKQYLSPIKQSYLDINPNLIQNPGW